MLANVYLHEFDMFIENLMQNMGCEMIANLQFQNIAGQLRLAKRKLNESNQAIDELHEQKKLRVGNLSNQLSKLHSRVVKDPGKANIRYVRYADDWIIGLKCTHAIAKDIYSKCKEFFEKNLNLQWNESKSFLQKSTEKDVEFLGVYLSFVKARQVRVLTFKGIGKTKDIVIPMYGGHTRNTGNFKTKIIKDDKVPVAEIIKNRQSSWLNLEECCICNYKKQKPGEIEMHHVKHIKKLGKKVHGFTRAM